MKILGFTISKSKKQQEVQKGLLTQENAIPLTQHVDFHSLSRPYIYSEITAEEAIRSYKGNANVFSVVKNLAQAAANLPFELMQGDKVIDKGEVYEAIMETWGKKGKRRSMNELFVYLLLTGDAYIYRPIESIGFAPKEQKILMSQLVTAWRRNPADPDSEILYYTYAKGGTLLKLLPEEIIHVQYFDPSLYGAMQDNGLSPLSAGKDTIESSNNLQTAEKSIFENGGAKGFISASNESMPLTPMDKQQLDEGTKARIGGADKFNKWVTMDTPINITEIGMTPQELEILETRIHHLRTICNLYGVPSELFNDPENKTHANRKEAIRSYYTEAVIPLAELFIDTYQTEVLTPMGEYWMRINTGAIPALNPDDEEKRKNIIEAWNAQLIRRNVALEKLGFDPEADETGEQYKDMNTQISFNNGTQN